MNAQQMLAMAGFPDTAEGRKAFYKQYPDEQSFHKKMKTGGSSGLAFPQQPTAGEFYAPQYTPNSPVGFYQNGGLAYPQQPPANMFFSGHPFTPEYASGGMPCMNCGGYMDDGGQASPFNYGQMPPAIGMAYGGSAKSFSKAMKKYFDDGGTASQGSTMEQNYLTDTNNLKRFIGGNVTNALSTEVYNQEQQQPVYDLGGEDTFNYGQADQLNAMQTGLDMSEQQRQYQKQQNMQNLMSGYALGGLPKHQVPPGQVASGAERMFGQAPTFGKKTAPLYFGHTQGANAANATSGSLNPEMIAKGNQLLQDIHNFNPSGAGVQFTPEQLRYLQQHGYGQQQNSVWNPGYKVRAKGWENSADGTKGNKWRSKGTSYSPFPTFGASGSYQAQGPGQGSFDMSHGLNAQQVADMNKYYEAHGMHMDYKQKNGLLGKWLGPKSYEMHIGSLNDHNQNNPAQSPTAPSSSNPSGGFHPFDGMKKRMAERKYNRSAEGMYDADVASGLYDDGKVTGLTYRNQTTPTATDQEMYLEESPERMAKRKAWEKNNPTNRAYGGTPSVYFPHGYQEGGANEVENDNDADDNDYEYMNENEIAAYMAAGGVIKYV